MEARSDLFLRLISGSVYLYLYYIVHRCCIRGVRTTNEKSCLKHISKSCTATLRKIWSYTRLRLRPPGNNRLNVNRDLRPHSDFLAQLSIGTLATVLGQARRACLAGLAGVR